MATDRDALAEALFSTYGQESRVRSLAIADAILTSDWLAQHDEEVREATKAGIAAAIEGLATRGPDNGARHPNTMRTIAARIARTWEPTP